MGTRWMTSRWWIIALMCLSLVLLSGPATVVMGDDDDDDDNNKNKTDFAFFDGSNPANQPNEGAECTVKGPATLHASVTASGSNGVVRLTYQDNDFVQFPIAANGVLQLTQAIGGTPGVSRRVRLSDDGTGANLVGALSVIGKGASCVTCSGTDVGGAPGCLNNP